MSVAHPHRKRTLIVLGASSDQLFLIRTARRMGLAVLAVDRNPDAPGFLEADDVAVISTRDVPTLIAYLEQRRAEGLDLAGVMTMGSDIPDVVAALAQRFGLPGPSPETARLATDKLAMKQRFVERGVPCPWFAEVRTLAELRATVVQRGPTLVLKPVDRSGSRGVFRLDEASDLGELYTRARDFSYTGRVMVEEYLAGPQISTETVLYDGTAVTPGFADRNYEDLPGFQRPVIGQVMENGAELPTLCTLEQRAEVEALVTAAAWALGITRGVAKGDVVRTPAGPRVIEIAARLSGGDFCESLVPLATGVNYVRTAIEIATGTRPDFAALVPTTERAVANRYFFPPPGILVAVHGVERVRAQPWVKKLELWYRPGDVVPPGLSHAHRFGVFVAVARDRDELERRVRWVYDTLRIETRAPAAASA